MRCISVRNVGCRKGFPYYAAALYEAVSRADGSGITWRYVEERSGWHRTHSACLRDLRNPEGYQVINGVRHGQAAPESLLCLLPELGTVD